MNAKSDQFSGQIHTDLIKKYMLEVLIRGSLTIILGGPILFFLGRLVSRELEYDGWISIFWIIIIVLIAVRRLMWRNRNDTARYDEGC